MKIIVTHGEYGCDTGCCGHVIEVDEGVIPNGAGAGRGSYFEFDHPNGEDGRKWAEAWVRETFGEEHVKDLDWDNCLISDS